MPRFNLDISLLTNLLRKHSLGELKSLKEIASGLINPVYLVNDIYILRLDLETHSNQTKFQRETVLYEVLPRFGIPTPHLITFDDSKEILDFQYILMNYIPGDNLRESFPGLSSQKQKEASFQLGHIASQIHSVKPEVIGHKDLFKNILSWSKWTMRDFEQHWEVVVASPHLTNSEKSTVLNCYEEYKKIDLLDHGRLTHGDFSMGNVQMRNGKIVGIFDFEFSFIADPLWDLQKLSISFQLGQSFDKQEFIKGYGKDGFSEDEKVRLAMYCYMQGVWEIWATLTQHMPFDETHIEEGVELVRNTIILDIA